MSVYLGIDIGGTKIAAGLVTGTGDVLLRRTRPTQAQLGGAFVLGEAIALAGELVAGSSDGITGIGVGAGGQIDAATGIVKSATDLLRGWAGTNVKEAFEARFGVTTYVDNDVNALAVGEHRFGFARGMRTVVFLALGTGVGGALLLDGRLHHGANGVGGEFGHLIVDIRDDAPVDAGGGKGTLEAYASGSGLVRTWREISGERDIAMTAVEIAEEARAEPCGSCAVAIERSGYYLGCGLASLANALDPEIIVIGGGLSELGDRLLSPARRALAERGLPGPNQCPVRVTALGHDASIIGAASLAMPGLG